jgi:predicted secreted hydrolase
MAGKLAIMADSDADYQRLGLSPTSIEAWEDGARTDNSRGTYEWWYFDAHLADGATLVVVFANKEITDPTKPLSPQLRLNLDLADGRHFEKIAPYPAAAWSSARDTCDVRMGENRFSGDLRHYRIEVHGGEIAVEVTLDGEVPPWRPSTGYMLFGTDRALEFAWLPSVPQGAVTVTYSIDGEWHETTGVGYHDHNWGNVALIIDRARLVLGPRSRGTVLGHRVLHHGRGGV